MRNGHSRNVLVVDDELDIREIGSPKPWASRVSRSIPIRAVTMEEAAGAAVAVLRGPHRDAALSCGALRE